MVSILSLILRLRLLSLCIGAPSPSHPHILLLVVDDYGWNDLGVHQNTTSAPNPTGLPTTSFTSPITPHLDQLAREGVRLEMYYVQPVCSPTRGAINTGRYPSHTGIGPGVISPTEAYGMPKEETMLAQIMKRAGYATAAIGKWHLGFCDERYTPTFRGFDEYVGYLNGAEDYWTHYRCNAVPPLPPPGTPQQPPPSIICSGIDDESEGEVKANFLDFRNGSTPNVLAASSNHSFDNYSAFVFAAEATRMATNHAARMAAATTKSKAKTASQPLFLYAAMQSVHEPLQAPLAYLEKYASIADTQRRAVSAMVTAMDDAIGTLVKGWTDAGLWDDTVLIFTTDNGGPQHSTHNNWPLRGGKFTNWEGGVRGNCFVRGTHNVQLVPLDAGVIGTWATPLMHASDWLPTINFLATGDTSPPQTQQRLDGFNQWDAIAHGSPSTRTSVVHNCMGPTIAHGESMWQGAVRLHQYKLLFPGMETTTLSSTMPYLSQRTPPPDYTPPSGLDAHRDLPPGINVTTLDGASHIAYFFDVVNDPLETVNLAGSTDLAVKRALNNTMHFWATYYQHAVDDIKVAFKGDNDPAANPALRADKTWGPFTNSKYCKW